MGVVEIWEHNVNKFCKIETILQVSETMRYLKDILWDERERQRGVTWRLLNNSEIVCSRSVTSCLHIYIYVFGGLQEKSGHSDGATRALTRRYCGREVSAALPKVVSWSKGTSLVALLSRWYRSQQLFAEKTVHYVENNGTIDFLSDFKGLNYWPGFSPPLFNCSVWETRNI